jgi:hypothetical protein
VAVDKVFLRVRPSLPCQYHSTRAPYSFIHLLPIQCQQLTASLNYAVNLNAMACRLIRIVKVQHHLLTQGEVNVSYLNLAAYHVTRVPGTLRIASWIGPKTLLSATLQAV